ncbi:hypothetical protein O3P69_009156 [Scylla paramamosain]|uniref:Uncharacterized protein n=1 Tax=Scylla paramamosain TaxID=85552 RepID=A0AAW0TA69_SCYPA
MDLAAVKVLLEAHERAFKSAMDIVTEQLKGRIQTTESTVNDLIKSLEFSQSELLEIKNQERFNQTLERAIAKFVNENHDDWDQHLDGILFSYRTEQHDSTKLTPFYVMFGCHAILPVDMDVNAAVLGRTRQLLRGQHRRSLNLLGDAAGVLPAGTPRSSVGVDGVLVMEAPGSAECSRSLRKRNRK